ncbi:MarR family winged helix-turn-helix transcriptional regulator [Kribbella sindirgiensis]|uniref:MarR family transcriptional regulator n=1 Tax=Kribbella sindirgiensis TaxID=1124744 RepID=A0A4R0IE20_9ACTN|nr:MarR family transcriptional regulator [Kribbella sindirgiensis]TCC31451.1 MarR family transcriptional regulator [Kribbella sindirgiensis]
MARKRAELVAALTEEMPWYISAAVRYQIAVADQLGMAVTDIHAVGALLEIGPAGVRRLADLMGLTTGAATRLVDRLEQAGFVRREPDPNDRRRVVVRLVPDRVADIARYYEPIGERWQQQVAGYSDRQLEFLLDFLRQGREDASSETVALRTTGLRHATRRRP